MKKENDVLQYVSNSLNQISDYITKKYPEREWMYRAQRLYWEKVYQANERGYPVVWHSLSVSPELLNAMGTVPVCLDGLASTLAALNMGANKYIDIAQKYVPDQICAVNKTGIGLAISRDIPKPNAVIYTSTPCDSARTAYPLIAEHLKVPHFCIDTPIEESERGYGYIANEIRGAVSFLEDVTKQKLNWEALAKAIAYSNQAYELISQIGELRKVVPCPLPGRLLVLNGNFLNMIGSPELVNFLRAEYNMGREKVERKEGHLAEEKIRIAWIQNLIFFDLGILDWMEKEYGAIVPMDAFGFRESCPIEDTSDEEKVFKGLAKRLLRIPMIHGTSGPAEFWMESVTEIVREYKCDAAIFAGHVGCKHTWAVGKLIKDMIFDKFGIPTLVFDVDSLDPRYTGPEIIKYRIKNFLEIIQ
jgi:benzoyl-CoA reductase/2-hydroxyglutaryl-CoA dehydratase subunit BcrC/BadD/HgdB